MDWLYYNGTIQFSRKARKQALVAARAFSKPEFFCDCQTYLLIDGLYPNVTRELKDFRDKLREARVKTKGKIEVKESRQQKNGPIEEVFFS